MHTIIGKASLILSLIGLLGGVFVPIFGTIDHIYWGERISSEMDMVFVLVFALVCLTGIIVNNSVKDSPNEEDKLRQYSYILSIIGLFINGVLIMMGLPGLVG